MTEKPQNYRKIEILFDFEVAPHSLSEWIVSVKCSERKRLDQTAIVESFYLDRQIEREREKDSQREQKVKKRVRKGRH